MDHVLHGQMMAQRLFLEQLVYRLREVKGFQMMGLSGDLSQLEANIGNADLPEELIEAAEEELRSLISAVQQARGQEG